MPWPGQSSYFQRSLAEPASYEAAISVLKIWDELSAERTRLLVCTEAVGVGVGLVRMLEPGGSVRPGAEMVGTVVAAGRDSAGFEAGDRVVFEDANAELMLADPRLVSHVPAKVDAAAALALVRGGPGSVRTDA